MADILILGGRASSPAISLATGVAYAIREMAGGDARPPRLSVFLAAAARRKFVWGEADCLLWLVPWIRLRRGVDAGEGFAGTYSDARGALRLVRAAGGMAGMLGSAVERFGIAKTFDPRPGDIAIADGPEGELGAIVLKRTIVCFAGPGLFMRPLPIVAAWRM